MMRFLWFLKDTRIFNYITTILLAATFSYFKWPKEEAFDGDGFGVIWLGWTIILLGLQEMVYLIGLIIVFVFKSIRNQLAKPKHE